MRNEKDLFSLMRRFIEIISEECKHNPNLSEKIEVLVSGYYKNTPAVSKRKEVKSPIVVPDIYQEWNFRNAIDFKLWLVQQPLLTLRAIIRNEQFDPTYKTSKWKEHEKLTEFIIDKLKSRISKGGSFFKDAETHQSDKDIIKDQSNE